MKQILSNIAPFIVLALFAVLMMTVVRTSIFGAVEPEKHIYFEIVFLLLLAVVGELVVMHLHLPSVMILLVLGILISPSFLSAVWPMVYGSGAPVPPEPPEILRLEEVIHVFAQLGAVILLFKVGLHNKIDGIFSKDNLFVAVAGVIVPFFVGFAYASLSGGNFAYSMFLGAALTATSVGVTVALLKEAGMLDERFAKIIIGAAVIDDILGLLVLSFVINISSGGDSLLPLAYTAVSAAVFLFGSIIAGDHFLRYLDRSELSPRRFMLAVAFMLLYAYVAEFIKLSAIVGAFIAGVILNRSRHINEIEEKTYGLELIFMPIFFISLGILVDVSSLIQFAIPILALTLIAMLTKVLPCAAASLLARMNLKESLAVGIGMSPRGEVALIVASLGLTSGILSSAEYSLISAMALLTTFLTPPMLSRLLK
ncbi:MAG TPA: cation:proton antiporter [Candidatus Bilamarchaeum sp.]|nr:cation:proton antiporter [Candidatus Bilamarchaeum sp.]